MNALDSGVGAPGLQSQPKLLLRSFGPTDSMPPASVLSFVQWGEHRAVVSKGVNTGLEQGTARSQHLRNATCCFFIFIIQNPNIKGVSTPNNEELGSQDVSILVLESTFDNNMKCFHSARG